MSNFFQNSTVRKIKRRINRALGLATFDTRGFEENAGEISVSREARQAAECIRGDCREAAIFIHGVMPRSGTVYTGEILRLHPQIHAYPNDLWEVPFLELTGDILDMQQHFFRAYPQNRDRMGEHDFLPLFGSTFMAYLQSFTPKGKRMLVKTPDAQYLDYFHSIFPKEHLLLLMRDGRDVVSSTLRTWPGMDFSMVSRKWAMSARNMLRMAEARSGSTGFLIYKFERVVEDPDSFVEKSCAAFGLEPGKFPFDEIRKLAVRGSSEIRKKGTVTWDPAEKPKDFNPVGRWQGWSRRQKEQFKRVAGEMLIEAGYCDDMSW